MPIGKVWSTGRNSPCLQGLLLTVALFAATPQSVGLAQTAESPLRSGLSSADAAATGVNTNSVPVGPATSLLSDPSRTVSELGRINLRASNVGPNGLISIGGALRPLANRRAVPVQGAGGSFEKTPYSAIGFRAGSFRIFPVIEQSIGFTSNADQVTGGDASAFSQTNGQVAFRSDWSLHELRGEIGASTIQYFDSDAEIYSLRTQTLNCELTSGADGPPVWG